MDDRLTVEKFLARDESALDAVRGMYGTKLAAFVKRLVSDEGAAEEVLQDTFFEAWNSIPPNEPNALYPYLARLARRNAVDRLRREGAKKRSAEVSELTKEMEECIPSLESVEAALEGRELAALINRWLAGVSEEKRNIFLRRYFFCDTVRETAKRYGISESRVKTTLFRMRNELKSYLEKNGYEV